MSSSGPKTPLERLLLEVRAQRPPTPREAGLPARLRAELRSVVAQPRSAVQRSSTSRLASWQLGVAGALAAAGTLLVLQAVEPESSERATDQREGLEPAQLQPGAVSALASVDGQPLATGTTLEATPAARTVQHPGRGSWVLLPGSQASLRSVGPVVRIELERGSLSAHVQPSEQPETFVVQARGTEVAVHGTRFSVSLQAELVRVEVSEGSVQVRPVGQRAATLLREQMRAEFLAGVLQPAPAPPGERAMLPPELSVEARAAASPPTTPSAAPGALPPRTVAREQASAALPPAPAAAPRDAASELALQSVTQQVQACFRRHLPGSRELGIEVSTKLGLWVEANGQLLRADFEPPLAPDIESCVAEQLVQFRAAPSPEGYRVERDLVLQR